MSAIGARPHKPNASGWAGSARERGEVNVISERSGKRLGSVNLGVGCNLIHRVWGRVAIDAERPRAYVVPNIMLTGNRVEVHTIVG